MRHYQHLATITLIRYRDVKKKTSFIWLAPQGGRTIKFYAVIGYRLQAGAILPAEDNPLPVHLALKV